MLGECELLAEWQVRRSVSRRILGQLTSRCKAPGGKFKDEALDATPLGAAEQVKEATKPVFVPRCFAARISL